MNKLYEKNEMSNIYTLKKKKKNLNQILKYIHMKKHYYKIKKYTIKL